MIKESKLVVVGGTPHYYDRWKLHHFHIFFTKHKNATILSEVKNTIDITVILEIKIYDLEHNDNDWNLSKRYFENR